MITWSNIVDTIQKHYPGLLVTRMTDHYFREDGRDITMFNGQTCYLGVDCFGCNPDDKEVTDMENILCKIYSHLVLRYVTPKQVSI
jgi:hypothetical protein